jgi:uncharacterized membrane protein
MTLAHELFRTVHITAGALGLLTGAVSMSLTKGAPLHRRVGTVFFGSMTVMAATGALMAVLFDFSRLNISGGLLTLYLVVSAWTTVRREPNRVGRAEWGVAASGAFAAAMLGTFAVRAMLIPAARPAVPFYLVFFSILLLATLADVRMVRAGGISGTARTTRHLWRMCTAMLIATMSFFLGQSQVFPAPIREAGVLPVPVALVALAMLGFFIQVRRRRPLHATAPRPHP